MSEKEGQATLSFACYERERKEFDWFFGKIGREIKSVWRENEKRQQLDPYLWIP